jgi:hypothetical protein
MKSKQRQAKSPKKKSIKAVQVLDSDEFDEFMDYEGCM